MEEKIPQAVEDNRPEPGYFARNMAASRAMRAGNTGVKKYVNKWEYIKGNLLADLKGTAIGAGGGALLGAGIGALMKNPGGGAMAGALGGSLIGSVAGVVSHQKKYLKDKGIDQGFWGVKGMTDEAKAKYLRDKYRGGGYSVENASSKVASVFTKLAQEDTRTFPLSRAYVTALNVGDYTIPGRIWRRAAQGRKNLGKSGITGSEQALLDKMESEDNGKTYPISRVITSPVTGGVLGGLSYASLARTLGKSTSAGALLGVGLGAGSTLLGRHLYSRAMEGRARKGQTGWTEGDKKLLRQLKSKEGEKTAQLALAKGLWGAFKTGLKGYGGNIAADWKALKNTTKGTILTGKKIKATGMVTPGQAKALDFFRKKRNKAMVGLAGRVGLPGVLGYNMLSGDDND